MTIDECILDCIHYTSTDLCKYEGINWNKSQIDQIAEWLELLKWYEQGMEDIPCESGVLPKDVYWAGYNKSIDDFVKFASDMPTVDEEDGEIRPMWLEEMAEQLKKGEIE